jgi:hypothetical protein
MPPRPIPPHHAGHHVMHHGWPDGSCGDGMPSACLFVSLAQSRALAPEVVLASVVRERATFIVSRAQLAGMTTPPDPYPPRAPSMP